MSTLDFTHDPSLRSWVAAANAPESDFPIQNLPYGRFRRAGSGEAWRIGVAIGDTILDLRLAAEQCPWPEPEVHRFLEPLAAGDLNAFMDLGPTAWRAVRHALSRALTEGSDQGPFLELCLVAQAEAELALPFAVRDYTDFYTGIHHATAVGKLFRPDAPLLPNYKWVPIGYHGRASSIVASGTTFHRPHGQLKASDGAAPVYAPARRLDHELELGAVVAGGNALGRPIPMREAENHLFGLVLLNDWSARDIQAWEYQPLGPFLSKSFATTLSPWVVTMDALAPYRVPFARPPADPAPLPHLDSEANRTQGALSIELEAWLQTAAMRARGEPAVRLSRANFRDAYWTLAQLVAHHASNGCNLGTGDLLGTGTQSGPGEGEGGSLLELTQGGKRPLVLPGGEERRFLEDGDTLELRAHAVAPQARRIGFGVCAGTVLPAVTTDA